jgi:tetratricopeptide (TPR) repeat protein
MSGSSKIGHTFIGGKIQAQWLNASDQQYIAFAYENLGRYYLQHGCFDQARLCYEEILQGEINVDVFIKSSCCEGIANVCERTGEYGKALVWLKKVIDLDLNGTYISTFESPILRFYPNSMIRK